MQQQQQQHYNYYYPPQRVVYAAPAPAVTGNPAQVQQPSFVVAAISISAVNVISSSSSNRSSATSPTPCFVVTYLPVRKRDAPY